MLNLFQYLVLWLKVQILKQVQDDGVVFRMTESGLFIIRIFILPCRHAEFISRVVMLNLFQYLVLWLSVQILKQVQDDGVVFRMTE
jgi:hypothetical protein